MGARIGYYKNNFKKGFKEIIFENFSVFRHWYLDRHKWSMEEFDEPFGIEPLKTYLRQNTDLRSDFYHLDKKIIDELTSEFIATYCDLTDSDSKILEFFGPMMATWRYKKSTELVLNTNDEEFIRLWNFIIIGRSLSDNGDFDSFTNDHKIGFLSFDEHRILKAKIEAHFGNIEQIKQKYRLAEQKLAKREAVAKPKDDSYSLSIHNLESSGLIYVLLALDEITTDENELITAIE